MQASAATQIPAVVQGQEFQPSFAELSSRVNHDNLGKHGERAKKILFDANYMKCLRHFLAPCRM